MFRYENSMRIYNEEKYPYSVEYVKESRYENYHGKCSENGFSIMAAGSKHLFCTPDLKQDSFKAMVSVSQAQMPGKSLNLLLCSAITRLKEAGRRLNFSIMKTH